MRVAHLALAAAIAAAPFAASAAARGPTPPIADVQVTIGPILMAKAGDYGRRDLDELARDLRKDVEGALGRAHRLDRAGGRLELVITDAQPNRPTFAQMSRNPSLSMRSISIGGASIVGVEIMPDGSRRPLKGSWWETDIRSERGAVTWTDADRAFDVFAHDYAAGRA